jgi:hypothetical protein
MYVDENGGNAYCNNMKRLLKVIFILLLVITGVEAGYYVYIKKLQNNPNLTWLRPRPSDIPYTPTPTPMQKITDIETASNLTNDPSHAPFQYEPDILDEVRSRIIDEEHKISIQFDDIGIVDDVKQNYTDSYNRFAEFYLSIAHKTKTQDPNEIRSSNYFLNKKDIIIFKVSPDGQKKEAAVSDIQKGDAIVVKKIINIIDFKTKQYNYSYSIEISK